ncbi:MAG TPA: tetratricopeptide repeat protein [Candidatus Obscuribacter sp.]|nr:tetratricopeptide repeat protein [Candidatus Obscuribacter sp.]MBK9277693.1 tetratricopeptide repeat protein [Candidatus Obscuribacter sp.]MBL8084317.1 tetratricopeptide repeat protein [Candidatus Obscuribacter sp.]HMY02376.1 tetratricopeptide repeat protein [Candidatus Obscuribacter sp.]HND65997.1 tetratricopeptide repeat protein [Candidatus Obscuribacter sp.]
MHKLVFSAPLFAFLIASFIWPAAWAQVASELAILSSWKANAKTSHLGNQLLTLLDATNRAIAVNPNDKGALYRRGYLYSTVGCTQSAISDLSRVVQIDPCFAAAYTERGICYLDGKNYDRSLSDLNRALQLNPYSGDAVFARGRLWLAQGKAQLALSDFRYCQQSNVKFAPVLPGEFPANQYDAPNYYIGCCYEAMNKPDEAVKFYKASLKTQPLGSVGYLHRYADQPLDTKYRVSSLEHYGY